MKAFEAATDRARADNDLIQELSTLITWRGFAGFSQWSELFPDLVPPAVRQQFGDDAINRRRQQARAKSGERFPELQLRRLLQIADETGSLSLIWNHQLMTLINVIDPDDLMLQVNFHRLRRMMRFAIDMGDVPAEMEAAYLIGRMYLIDENATDAFLYPTRTIELGRIVGHYPSMLRYAHGLLELCMARLKHDYVREMQKHIRLSMWGRPD